MRSQPVDCGIRECYALHHYLPIVRDTSLFCLLSQDSLLTNLLIQQRWLAIGPD